MRRPAGDASDALTRGWGVQGEGTGGERQEPALPHGGHFSPKDEMHGVLVFSVSFLHAVLHPQSLDSAVG